MSFDNTNQSKIDISQWNITLPSNRTSRSTVTASNNGTDNLISFGASYEGNGPLQWFFSILGQGETSIETLYNNNTSFLSILKQEDIEKFISDHPAAFGLATALAVGISYHTLRILVENHRRRRQRRQRLAKGTNQRGPPNFGGDDGGQSPVAQDPPARHHAILPPFDPYDGVELRVQDGDAESWRQAALSLGHILLCLRRLQLSVDVHNPILRNLPRMPPSFLEQLKEAPQLTHVSLAGTSDAFLHIDHTSLERFLTGSQQLTSLRMSHVHTNVVVGDRGGLASAIQNHGSLQKLVLDDFRVENDRGRLVHSWFAPALTANNTLEELQVRSPWTPNSTPQLAAMLRANSSISKVTLRLWNDTPIATSMQLSVNSDWYIVPLAQSIQRLPATGRSALQYLTIESRQLDLGSVQALVDMVQDNYQLKRVYYNYPDHDYQHVHLRWMISFYLNLNRQGRARWMTLGGGNMPLNDWIDILSNHLADDPSSIFFVLQLNLGLFFPIENDTDF